jgi:DNA topoisomerase-1
LQCTGRDAKGRKQSRYHADFRATRDEAKYDKVLDFAAALPKLRRTVKKHLALPGLPREKVLATIVSLLEKTLIRIGNDEYAKMNNSFGLTTIRNKHAKVSGSHVRFSFKGKSGVSHDIELDSPQLARIIRRCQELPEQELFEYIDESGTRRDVKSNDVNAYLKEITGQPFTAKDFRTWAGTVLAAAALREFEKFDSQAQAKKNVVAAIERVAERLGNTKAVCRKCYVHPVILESYLGGTLAGQIQQRAEREMKHLSKLPPEEVAVVTLLQQQLKKNKSIRLKPARPLRKSA